MKKIVIFSFLYFLTLLAFSQKTLVTKTCNRWHSRNEILSDTNSSLYGNFRSGCSWQCNSTINMESNTFRSQDEGIADIVQNPIDKKIEYYGYLTSHNISSDTIKKDEEDKVALHGILLVNGNKKSKQDYIQYSRIKKAFIYVDGKLIGQAFFQDTPKIQFLYLDDSFELSQNKKVKVTIEIKEVYQGLKNELVISEMELDGIGGHSLVYKMCWQE